MTQLAQASARSSVPVFFLYGEPRRSVDPRFLHVESLEERSRPTGWTIRPHAHAELHHLFLIARGGGRMEADGWSTPFSASCLLTIPARTVHGFAWEPETSGQVLTIADGYLRDLLAREPGFQALFTRPTCLAPACLADADGEEMQGRLAALSRELVWAAPGHAAAVDAHLLMVLVASLRLLTRTEQTPPRPNRAVELVARFREAVEARYRAGWTVGNYAIALGATPSALRRACLRAAGCPPSEIIQDRCFLEAQRLLLFTSMAVGEVGLALGFDDNAYFTRFFTRRAGQSPRQFRAARRVAL